MNGSVFWEGGVFDLFWGFFFFFYMKNESNIYWEVGYGVVT